ncbi:MAG: hypothetical protein U0X93_06700 [Anaerolineales bacterium]
MLSHELAEVREIGERVKEVSKAETPTLVKYADTVPYLTETIAELSNRKSSIENRKSDDWCSLIDYDKDGEKKILAAALYRLGEMSYADALSHVGSLNEESKSKLAESY